MNMCDIFSQNSYGKFYGDGFYKKKMEWYETKTNAKSFV